MTRDSYNLLHLLVVIRSIPLRHKLRVEASWSPKPQSSQAEAICKLVYVRVFTKVVTTNWILEAGVRSTALNPRPIAVALRMTGSI